MLPDAATLALARAARTAGLLAALDSAPGCSPDTGIGALCVRGRDAVSFLQAQVTQDVTPLSPGEGTPAARVTRTGHLLAIFSLHRLPDDPDGLPSFLLLTDPASKKRLAEKLDAFIFSDDVSLEDWSDRFAWFALEGPKATAAAAEAFGARPGAGWDALIPHGVSDLAENDAPEGTLAFGHSLTGEAGLLLALPRDAAPLAAARKRLRDAARAHGLSAPEGEPLAEVLDILRIEAGRVRLGPDTLERDRLLPETGLEQQLVSYTKGCYLGQEVIARVRTYGSLPQALRGLVLEPTLDDLDAAGRALASLPEAGADLAAVPDRKIGQIVSRTLSPTVNAPIAFAYLDRAHRTPGTELTLVGRDGPIRARVTLLPFYRAPGHADRVQALYDQAIAIFSEGREEDALAVLEKALRIDPAFADGYEAIGVILGRSGRFHEAIDLFRRLEEVAPDAPIVNTNLSLYYMKLGDKATAERQAARALEKSMAAGTAEGDDAGQASPADAARAAAEARRTDATRKREMFRQVLEIDPVDPVALFGLGSALCALEAWAEAAEVLGRATESDRNNSAVYLARGRALERLDCAEEAIRVYRAGIEVASRRGDLMPLREMENRIMLLRAVGGENA